MPAKVIRNHFSNDYSNYLFSRCAQELQLHLGVLQQHAALIGGPNATSCPICHKLFLGADALMEHMKHTHKDPNANAGATSKYLILIFLLFFLRFPIRKSVDSQRWNGLDWSPQHTHHKKRETKTKVKNEISDSCVYRCVFFVSFASSFTTDPAKRRTANHPCPVCGKHYVNEGSLRKHLACHPETSQLTTSLRMWPCSVCQAVFTHESG